MPGGCKSGGVLLHVFIDGIRLGASLLFFAMASLVIPYCWVVGRRLRNRLAHALNGNGPGPGERARVASRAALATELVAAGFKLSLSLKPDELLHVFRRRLTEAGRKTVLAAVSASHIVGDDVLSPLHARYGPLLGDIWKTATKFRLADASHPHPLVLFPDHLTRLRDRVAHEFAHNSDVTKISVLVTVPREKLEASTDWATFSAAVDASLLTGWGEGVGVLSVVGFQEPLPLQRYPSAISVLPPTSWEVDPLPVRSAAVVLTIGKMDSAVVPVFTVVGTYTPIADLRAKDRGGLTRVMVEIDLVQRHTGRQDLTSFGRRALGALIAATDGGAAFPRLSLRGIAQRGDMVSGFVELPADRAAALLKSSGAIRGIFARPWVNGGDTFPFPPGVGPDSHRIIWAKVARYSDVIVGALRAASVSFDGLVCPRLRGEVGVRVPRGVDLAALKRCMDSLDAKMKTTDPQRSLHRLRASEVPLALLDKLSLVVTRLDADFTLVSSRVVRTGRYSMVVDFQIRGASPAPEYRLDGLGMRPVVVKLLAPRKPAVPISRLAPGGRVPIPSRPLSSIERTSWASVVQGVPPVVAPSAAPASATFATAVMIPSPTASEDEVAEIPKRSSNRQPAPVPPVSGGHSSRPAPSSSAPAPSGKRGSPTIPTLFSRANGRKSSSPKTGGLTITSSFSGSPASPSASSAPPRSSLSGGATSNYTHVVQ